MDYFSWKEQYSVGVGSIARQHQKLVGYLKNRSGAQFAPQKH